MRDMSRFTLDIHTYKSVGVQKLEKNRFTLVFPCLDSSFSSTYI